MAGLWKSKIKVKFTALWALLTYCFLFYSPFYCFFIPYICLFDFYFAAKMFCYLLAKTMMPIDKTEHWSNESWYIWRGTKALATREIGWLGWLKRRSTITISRVFVFSQLRYESVHFVSILIFYVREQRLSLSFWHFANEKP